MNEEGIILPHHALPQSSHVGLPAPGFAPVPSQVSQTLEVQRLSVWGGGGSWFLRKYGDECFWCFFQLVWRWKCVIRCANMLYIYILYIICDIWWMIYDIYISNVYTYIYISYHMYIMYIPMIAIFCQPPIFWNKVITGRIPTSYMTWNLRKSLTWHSDIYIYIYI